MYYIGGMKDMWEQGNDSLKKKRLNNSETIGKSKNNLG